MKPMKIILLLILVACVLPLLVMLVAYFAVEVRCRNRVFSDVEQVPYNRVGLLLGTNPQTKSGKMNYYYKYRIDACVALYKAGKISKVLISGDNHSKDYNEPEWMQQSLMEQGIPASDIVLDFAGFRTLDSVVRSKEIFGQSKLTIISQGFHNYRAVCLALHYGIDAVAFNSKQIKMTPTYLIFGIGREALARTKMFLDFLTGKSPKYLGEKIEM